jgi:hypothetical protein
MTRALNRRMITLSIMMVTVMQTGAPADSHAVMD